MYKLGTGSKQKLQGVHLDLTTVLHRAIEISRVDFGVTEGLRSEARQEKLVADGKSQTMNSRHLTGHAVDLVAWVDGGISWKWYYYDQIAKAVKKAAEELDIDIKWGGDWKSLKDGPHFELSREEYPA